MIIVPNKVSQSIEEIFGSKRISARPVPPLSFCSPESPLQCLDPNQRVRLFFFLYFFAFIIFFNDTVRSLSLSLRALTLTFTLHPHSPLTLTLPLIHTSSPTSRVDFSSVMIK